MKVLIPLFSFLLGICLILIIIFFPNKILLVVVSVALVCTVAYNLVITFSLVSRQNASQVDWAKVYPELAEDYENLQPTRIKRIPSMQDFKRNQEVFEGTGFLECPVKMIVGQTYYVFAIISGSTGNDVKGKDIDISQVMGAELVERSGQSFTIHPLTANKEQRIIKEGTKWEWNITPLNTGNYEMMLKIWSKFETGDFLHHTSYNQLVDVRFSFSYYTKRLCIENWKPIIGFIAGTIVAFVIAIYFPK